MDAKYRLLEMLATKLSKKEYEEVEKLLDEIEGDVYDRAMMS